MADFGNIEVDGFVKQREELDKLMISNPAMEKKVQGLIRKVLGEVKKHMGEAAGNVMKNDPRQAYKAVKMSIYKRILGGNVSILRKKRASNSVSAYIPTRTLRTGQRGGNRRLRSERTMKLESYVGSDRGFVLRFLNSGTKPRGINFTSDEARERVHRGSQGGDLKKYGKTINTGNRGNIAPRNFFGNRSHMELAQAAKNLEALIDNLLKEELA